MNLPSIEDFDDDDQTSVYHSGEEKSQVSTQKNRVEVIFTPNVPTWGVTGENHNFTSLIAEKHNQAASDEGGSEMEDLYVNSIEKQEQPSEVAKIKEFFDTPLKPLEPELATTSDPNEEDKQEWTCKNCEFVNSLDEDNNNNVCSNCYQQYKNQETFDENFPVSSGEASEVSQKSGGILQRKKRIQENKRIRSGAVRQVVDNLISRAFDDAVHKSILLLKPRRFEEEMERIKMEEQDRNWWKDQDFENRRRKRLEEVQNAFGIGNFGVEDEASKSASTSTLTLEEAIAENIRKQELAAKQEHERRERERRKITRIKKRRKEEYHEDTLNHFDDLNNMESKILVQRLANVSRAVRLRLKEAKSKLIGEVNNKANLEENSMKFGVSSIQMLNEMSEAVQLLKNLDAYLPCIRDVLVTGFQPKRKPNMQLAREKYNKKYFKAKKQWSPDIEALKRKREDENLYTNFHIPPRPSQKLTKAQHEQIEKNISKQIENLKKDILQRKKRAEKRHAKREKQWSQQRLYGSAYSNDRLKIATEHRIKAEKLAESAKRRWDPAKRVSTLFRRLGTNDQDRLIRVALVAAGEKCPVDAYDRRDKLEQWLKAVDFRRRDAPNPPRTINAVQHFIQNLKRSYQVKMADETTIGELRKKEHVVTNTGRTILTPAYVSPIKAAPKVGRSKREVLHSVDDSARFRNRKTTEVLIEDESWKRDFDEALHTARMIRNKNRVKRKQRKKSPSPIKLAPLPLDAYEGKLNKEVFVNEIDRQAKLETLEQVGFLWDENEDDVETESRINKADKRRAKSPDTMSPLFKQLQQEEYLKYEQRLADEEEARMLAKWGESGKPPEEFSGLYRTPANIMDAIKDPMNMTL